MTPKSKYHNHKVCVKYAGKKKGRGVFASQDIAKGDIIELSPAIHLPNKQGDICSETNLADYMFEGYEDHDAVIGLGYTSIYNHSSKPNASFSASYEYVVIYALKDIKKDEEILTDYEWEEEYLKGLDV